MKSDNTIIIESMAARIRDLEEEARKSNEKADIKSDFEAGVKSAFSKFITQKQSADNFLEFESHINHELTRFSKFQPDILEAYLWVFEIANDEGLLEYAVSGLDDKSRARILGNIEKYRAQLKHWEKTGETPKN